MRLTENANQLYYEAYEQLVNLLMLIQNEGLGGTREAKSVEAALVLLKEAFDKQDIVQMNEVCKLVQRNLVI